MFRCFRRKHFTTDEKESKVKTPSLSKKLSLLIGTITLSLAIGITAYAAETFQYPSGPVPVYPSKNSYKAWTLPVWDTHTDTVWVYPTGVTDRREVPASPGHHYYPYAMFDNETVNVISWENYLPGHHCSHNDGGANSTTFCGIPYGQHPPCHNWLSPGWIASCAECGEHINIFFYTSEERIKNVKSLTIGDAYISKCIACDNIEQGTIINHRCRTESINQYYIEYNGNGATAGYVERSSHYVSNDAQVYYERYLNSSNNNLRTNKVNLNANTFSRTGYTFKGWSTSPTGSVVYADRASTANINATCPEDGSSVTLYAVWEPNTHSVTIDANGGKYDNQDTVSRTGAMNTTVTLDANKLTAPRGYTVTFNANGGTVVGGQNSITSTKVFNGWQQSGAFKGNLIGSVYTYPAPTSADTIKAEWRNGTITLPNATRSGYLFTGWFSDAACSAPVGNYGDTYTVSTNTTLYAGWAGLSLTSVEDYVANNKKGAVDLFWSQGGSDARTYKVYQSPDNSNWSQLNAVNGNVEAPEAVLEVFDNAGTSTNWEVPTSGVYRFTIYGAQGGDYGTHKGGKGGKTTCLVYLPAGATLKVDVGAKGGGGNATAFGAGGTCSAIYRTDNTQCMALAGGGGGASPSYDGGPGGNTNPATLSNAGAAGESGAAGGGYGMKGGVAGSVIYHTHTAACGSSHEHTTECYEDHRGLVYRTHDYNGGSRTCPNGHGYGISQYWNRCRRCDWSSRSGTSEYCPTCGWTGRSSGDCSWATGQTTGAVHCNADAGNVLVCTSPTGYVCGKTEESVDSATMSYGGNNYVNSSYVYSYEMSSDVREGNGWVQIESIFLGTSEAMSLADVPAPDLAKPNTVSDVTYGLLGNVYTFQWFDPGDNGTTYYHKVTSLTTSGTNIGQELVSSPTVDTLTTNVDKYYWKVSSSSSYNPTASDNVVNNSSGPVTVTFDRSSLTAGTYYFCVAPVDVAGNVGDTRRITLTVPAPITDNTITFNYNGREKNGATSTTKTVRAFATDNNNVSDIFTKNSITGSTFHGWNLQQNGRGVQIYDDTGKYTGDGTYWNQDGKWIGTQNITVYAQWSWNEYDVIYTIRPDRPPTGGSTYESGYDTSQHTKYADSFRTLNRDNSTITRKGYLLKGWNTNNASNTVQYNMNQTLSKLSATDGDTIRMYACWDPITYTVKYSKWGVDGERWGRISTTEVTCRYDTSFRTWGADTLTRDGYTLIGWDVVPNKTANPKYALGQTITNLTDVDGFQVTLYPVWEQNSYTVRYHNDQNNTYVDQENCLWTETYNSYLNGVETDFIKEGYYVAYWTNREGTLVLTADPLHESEPSNVSSTFQSLTSDDDAVVDVYPVWEQNKYYIQYLPYTCSPCSGSAPSGATTWNYLKPSFNNGTTRTITFGGDTFTAIKGNASSATSKSVPNAIKYSYEDTVTIPYNSYTNENSVGIASEFKGWSMTSYATTGTIQPGATYTKLTPERNQVLQLYATFDQYPVIEVTPPTGIPYSSDEPGVITLSTLVSYPSLSALSGSLAESWLINNCVSYTFDREGPTTVYISYFDKEELSSVDRPTLLTITFTIEDNIGQCTSVTTYWEIYANGTTNILIN